MCENQSDTDFFVALTAGTDIHGPPIALDYNVAGYSYVEVMTAAFNTAADFVANAYFDFTLDAEGLASINRNGFTNFIMRSNEDSLQSTPIGEEWVTFWSSESTRPPIMTITYTVPVLGNPDSMTITNVAVFSSYTETDDQLFVFSTNIQYQYYPDEFEAGSYFNVQLLDGAILEAQVPVQRWGYGPLSIYLNPASALPVDGAYTLRLMGLPTAFLVPPTPFDYTLSSANYKGSSMALLDTWLRGTTNALSTAENQPIGSYFTSVGGQTVINDYATDIFVEGIPLINAVRPEMFSVSSDIPADSIVVPNTASGTLYGLWGAHWIGIFDDLGSPIGLDGVWVSSVFFVGLAVAIVALVRSRIPENPNLSLIAALPVMMLGLLFGVPLWVAVVISVISVGLFAHNLTIRSG
jgi:hypothetical protein